MTENQNTSSRPKSERESFLERLLAAATVPEAREVIERELDAERGVQEITILVAAAEQAGESELAAQLSAIGPQKEGGAEEAEDDGEITAEEMEWLEQADAEAQALENDKPADAAKAADKLKAAWGAKRGEER